MADTELRITATVVDKAKRPLEEIRKELQSAGKLGKGSMFEMGSAVKQMVGSAGKDLGGLVEVLGLVSGAFGKITAFAGAAGGALGIFAAHQLARSRLEMHNFAVVTGTSVQEIKAFESAASAMGISVERAQPAMGMFQRNLMAIHTRRGALWDEMRRAGAAPFMEELAHEYDTQGVDAARSLFFKRLKNVASAESRGRIAELFFGDMSFAMMGGELDALMEKYRKQHPGPSTDQMKAYSAAWAELNASLDDLKVSGLTPLIRHLTSALQGLTEFLDRWKKGEAFGLPNENGRPDVDDGTALGLKHRRLNWDSNENLQDPTKGERWGEDNFKNLGKKMSLSYADGVRGGTGAVEREGEDNAKAFWQWFFRIGLEAAKIDTGSGGILKTALGGGLGSGSGSPDTFRSGGGYRRLDPGYQGGGGGNGGGSSGEDYSPSGGARLPSGKHGENAQRIYDELRRLGHSHEQASAALGHVQAESGFNPNATGDGGTAHGFFQHRKDRWALANKLAAQEGTTPFSPEAAARHFDYELKHGERKAGARYFGADNVRDAVTALNGYERFAGWQRGQAGRYSAADKFSRSMRPSEGGETAGGPAGWRKSGKPFLPWPVDAPGVPYVDDTMRINRALMAQVNKVEGSASIRVDVNAPKGTHVDAGADGMFKNVQVQRSTQMGVASDTSDYPGYGFFEGAR